MEMKDNVCVGPLQTEILKGSVGRVPAHDTHLIVVPIRCADVESGKACPLPPELQVLHDYTMLIAGSKYVSIVVRNMTDNAIFLKKGVRVAHVVSAMLVPPAKVPTEESVKGVELPQEQMSVQEQHEKLMDKLNLNGLTEWSPRNAYIARELSSPITTSLHSSLMSWGVPVPSNMKSSSMTTNLSKNISGAFLRLC